MKLGIGLVLGTCVALGAAQAADNAGYKILKLEGNNVRWHTVASARPLVTYSLVSTAVDFPAARNCRKMTSLDGLLASSEVSTELMRAEVSAAFSMWQRVANISFREAEKGEEPDILIGAQVEPEGWAFADVFYDVHSAEPIKPISKALVCLNPARSWKVGFNGDLKTYDLRYTLTHEIGHAIGLDHPNGPGEIMGYRYEENFRELQSGDVAGAVQLYGERNQNSVEVAATTPAKQRAAAARRFASKKWGTRAFTARSP